MTSVDADDGRVGGRRISAWIAATGACVGLVNFAYYYAHGLTTAHYDAKAHLVVARRIVDSIAPGYQQMGANWLPLLHLLYLPFVTSDVQYRSAVIPSLISVCAFTLSGWLIYRIVARSTGSFAAGIFAAVMLLANANLEYLQSCPLTEPLSILLLLLTVDSLLCWRDQTAFTLPWQTALWAAMGALCRYEGWYVFAGVLLLLACDCWSGRIQVRRTVLAGALCSAVFAVPVLAHFGIIYMRLGDSFLHRVARGNPTPYVTYRRPVLSALYHMGELIQASAAIPFAVAIAGVIFVFADRSRFRKYWPLFLLWIPSLTNISALYWGLIYRVRYSVLLVPAVAVFAALTLTERARKAAFIAGCLMVMGLPWLAWYFPREWRYHVFLPGPGVLALPVLALALLLVAAVTNRNRWPLLALCVLGTQFPVLQGEARPILEETREHAFIEPERQAVLEYLHENYDGTLILLDMGKLAPLAYDSGLPLKNFIYNEGQSRRWHAALHAPETEVGWLCAEKGDEVWEWLRFDPGKAAGYSLALRTENFLLYRLKTTLTGASLHSGITR